MSGEEGKVRRWREKEMEMEREGDGVYFFVVFLK